MIFYNICQLDNYIGIDLKIDDNNRIWLPPAFVAKFYNLDWRPYFWIRQCSPIFTNRPYWTEGINCKQQCCGRDLTDEEIDLYVAPMLNKLDLSSQTCHF